ncbi:MAG: hypothetical protein DHS20C14_09560 [Phycisphaeraceae bacterium]|nr:MAG: hypothetical protein DHS20C14_09560 [Phycisphaeraceae bacterium]
MLTTAHNDLSWTAQTWSPIWFYNHVPGLGSGADAVFCAIPKNGCKSFKRVFMRATGDAIGLDEFRPGMHVQVAERWSMSNIPKPERAAILDSARTIVFLRDPALRIASAYADKVARVPDRADNASMYADVWAHENLPGAPTAERGISFSEFVRYLARTACDAMDPHWKPQACYTAGRTFGFVGDVSHMARDLNRMQDWLGIDVGRMPERPQVARAAGTPGEHADTPAGELLRAGVLPGAESLYTLELTCLIEARYSEDRELFERLVPARAA